jgi:archaellum biogenesis ATPase FlaH
MVKAFIQTSVDTVVLLDGIEYLIMQNSFEHALELIQGLNDVVVQSNSRLIITLDPLTISERQWHLLRTELMEFSP